MSDTGINLSPTASQGDVWIHLKLSENLVLKQKQNFYPANFIPPISGGIKINWRGEEGLKKTIEWYKRNNKEIILAK